MMTYSLPGVAVKPHAIEEQTGQRPEAAVCRWEVGRWRQLPSWPDYEYLVRLPNTLASLGI